MPPGLEQARGALDPAAVHDTVAAIVRRPEFANSARESLVGRFARYLIEHLAELLDHVHGSSATRALVIGTVALIVIVVIGRVLIARGAEADAARLRAGSRAVGVAGGDPWIAADALAAEGRYVDACHVLYAAIVR